MNKEQIKTRILRLYAEADIEISGADCNLEVLVISDQFIGISRLKRQQSILALFSEELRGGKLHAMSVKAKTRSECAENNEFVHIKM